MKIVTTAALMVAALSVGSAALADPALEKQVQDALGSSLANGNPHFDQVKSDASGHVCGYVTLHDNTTGSNEQHRFLGDAAGKYWIEKMLPGGDSDTSISAKRAREKAIKASDFENGPVWRTCHK